MFADRKAEASEFSPNSSLKAFREIEVPMKADWNHK